MRANQERAIKLVDRLIKLSPDKSLARQAKKMRAKLMLLPMSEVLKKVPGVTLASKARYVGVAKETCHGWNKGLWRPNPAQARKLAKITGYTVDLIRGDPIER